MNETYDERRKPSPKWICEFMNNCIIYFKDGLMHGVDINKTVELCSRDREGSIAALDIFAQMLYDNTRKDKGAEMMAVDLFISYLLMCHQQASLPIEAFDLSILPPELEAIKKRYPIIEKVANRAITKAKIGKLGDNQ